MRRRSPADGRQRHFEIAAETRQSVCDNKRSRALCFIFPVPVRCGLQSGRPVRTGPFLQRSVSPSQLRSSGERRSGTGSCRAECRLPSCWVREMHGEAGQFAVPGQDVPEFLKTIQVAVVERWCLVQFRQLCPLHWSDREEHVMSPVAVTLLQAITKQARIPRDYGRDRRLAIAGETRRPLVGGNGCSGPPLPLSPNSLDLLGMYHELFNKRSLALFRM